MNQKDLFAWEQYTEQDVRSELGAIQPVLWQCIMEPWRELGRLRLAESSFRYLPPGGIAQWLHYQIVGRVREHFPESERLGEDAVGWQFDENGMFHLEYKFTELTFKKLDEDFQRSNYLTAANCDYWTQQLLPGIPSVIKLIVGYQWVDETAADIQRVAVVCPARRGARWWYEISDPAQAVMSPTLAPEPEVPSQVGETDKGFRVKSKKKANRENEGRKAAEP